MTFSVDIAAERTGTRYIPAHQILAIKGASLDMPVGKTRLIPDQLFALDYGGSFRAFALEVDRGTEPATSASSRKSLARSIEQYAAVIEQGLYKSHYGLKANMLVLWVFCSAARQRRFLEMLGGCTERVRGSALTTAVGQFEVFSAANSLMLSSEWQRSGLERFSIA